tara:strand:- start:1546 stop:1698 length:153 start_codon:yes stop_codon:yes gene_type:complete
MKNLKLHILVLFLAIGLAGCGVKPSSVDAPQGNDQDSFPHTYPNEETREE